ncbi:hypothetical protein GCM10010398_61120 [Streptomyces fimbriatus]
MEADARGRDVRDWLRAEAVTLEKLKDLQLAPEPLAVFEHAEHVFLAQEEVPGVSLRTWVAEHFRDVGADRYRADTLDVVTRLVDLVSVAHAHGCVLRDLTPGNVMVRPDGELRLIDLELTVWQDSSAVPTRLGTPGFSAPERLADAPVSPTADYYSLGATACFILAGKVPQLLPDEPATRPPEQRLATWLAACAGPLRLPDGLTEMLIGLMRDDPGERWDLTRARGSPQGGRGAVGVRHRPSPGRRRRQGGSRARRPPHRFHDPGGRRTAVARVHRGRRDRPLHPAAGLGRRPGRADAILRTQW